MQQCTRDPSRDEAASRSSWLKVVSRWHTQQVGSECSLCQGCQQHRDVHRNWGSVECKVEAGDLSESFVFSAGRPPSKRHQRISVAKSHYGYPRLCLFLSLRRPPPHTSPPFSNAPPSVTKWKRLLGVPSLSTPAQGNPLVRRARMSRKTLLEEGPLETPISLPGPMVSFTAVSSLVTCL